MDTARAGRLTGVNRAPEWKDDFDNATQERMLLASAPVVCSALEIFGLDIHAFGEPLLKIKRLWRLNLRFTSLHNLRLYKAVCQ
jgi:hypothetical protein